ncbi:MAG: hypothetical protein ABIA67_07230, partial [Candidatus Margulisiibacteriota bacterium]
MIKRKGKKASESKKKPKKTEEKHTAIGERNRIALAFMELARDKTFQKLEEEQKLKLIKEVLSIGDEVAGWIVNEHETNDPRKIAAKLGVKIFGEDRGRTKRSEYRKEK